MINAEPDMETIGEAEEASRATSDIMSLRPEIVIVDISLKGNSGLELIKNIKSFDPSIQILVLSMHDESVYALRVLKAGARAYVMKHEMAQKVMEAIRRIRNGKMYVSDRVASQMLNRLVGDRNETDNVVSSLSDRELEIVTLIGGGLPTREIASKLNISIKTVETHRAHIKTKLDLSDATRLVQFCVRWVENSRRNAEGGEMENSAMLTG